MATTPTILYAGGQLPTTASRLYQNTANSAVIITQALFTNVDTATRTFTVYVVRSGGTPTPANTAIQAQQLGAGEAYPSIELPNVTLGYGDALYALASAPNAVTVSAISGVVIS